MAKGTAPTPGSGRSSATVMFTDPFVCCSALGSDDPNLGTYLVDGLELAGPVHRSRGTGHDLGLHLLRLVFEEGVALVDVATLFDELLGQRRLGDGHREPRDPDGELRHLQDRQST